MAKKPIDLLELMKLARDRKKNNSSADFHVKAKNLLSHAYVDYKNMYVDFCKSKGEEYKDKIFYIFQHIFVFLMMGDSNVSKNEYECYKVFCNYCKVEPLTQSDCRALYTRLETDTVVGDIEFLRDLRDYLKDADDYEAMVQGFCYFCLADSKNLNETQYLVLSFFFENMDTIPSNWGAYKRKTLLWL